MTCELDADQNARGTLSYKLARIVAYERRNAAMHEAAHFSVVCWTGVRHVGAWIAPVADCDPHLDRTYTGQTVFGSDYHKLSEIRRFMIGVAGAMGECLWRDGPDPCISDILTYYDLMSSTDWPEGCSSDEYPAKLERAGEKVVELLNGALRQPWLSAARSLIVHGEVYTSRDAKMQTRIARFRKSWQPADDLATDAAADSHNDAERISVDVE